MKTNIKEDFQICIILPLTLKIIIFPPTILFTLILIPIAPLRNYKKYYIFFLSGFSFTDTQDSHDSRETKRTIFISLYYFHSHTNIHRILHVR